MKSVGTILGFAMLLANGIVLGIGVPWRHLCMDWNFLLPLVLMLVPPPLYIVSQICHSSRNTSALVVHIISILSLVAFFLFFLAVLSLPILDPYPSASEMILVAYGLCMPVILISITIRKISHTRRLASSSGASSSRKKYVSNILSQPRQSKQ